MTDCKTKIKWKFHWINTNDTNRSSDHEIGCQDIESPTERIYSVVDYLSKDLKLLDGAGTNLTISSYELSQAMKKTDGKVNTTCDVDKKCYIKLEDLMQMLAWYLYDQKQYSNKYQTAPDGINVNGVTMPTITDADQKNRWSNLMSYLEQINGGEGAKGGKGKKKAGKKAVKKGCEYKKTAEKHLCRDGQKRVVYVRDGRRYVKRKSAKTGTFRYTKI